MHVQSGCFGNDSDVVIPSFPCSDSQQADSPRLLMDGSNGLELALAVTLIWPNETVVHFSTTTRPSEYRLPC